MQRKKTGKKFFLVICIIPAYLLHLFLSRVIQILTLL